MVLFRLHRYLLLTAWVCGNSHAINLAYPLLTAEPVLPIGVSSLASNSEGSSAVAGTKSGRILVSSTSCESGRHHWTELPTDEYHPKLPVYSLTFGADNNTLFAGDGDRFVSTWRLDVSSSRFIAKLGPHTGWVKDVAFDVSSNILYSIGCNCIEGWDCSNDPMQHVSKRTVETSPGIGSTLSSDMLCLCLAGPFGLASGGVDGRIHLWSLDPVTTWPLASPLCHDGRVNKIVYLRRHGLIFSAGHDGKVVVSRPRTSSLEIAGAIEVDELPRLSTLYVVQEDNGGCLLMAGTTNGHVILIVAQINKEKITLSVRSGLHLNGQPSIYSICRGRQVTGERGRVAAYIGHASGLVEVKL